MNRQLIRAALRRARYAQETRQWAVLSEARRTIRHLWGQRAPVTA